MTEEDDARAAASLERYHGAGLHWLTGMVVKSPILPYVVSQTTYVQYDPAAVRVAMRVVELIETAAPWVSVEHIGSTSIPGCAGKGVIDLMAMYPTGKLDATRAAIDKLGFQRQQSGHVFPEDRPMRVGAIAHERRQFRLHVHLIDANSEEVAALRQFRDALRADCALRDAYQARKKQILESGVSEPADYTSAKGEFIQVVIGDNRQR